MPKRGPSFRQRHGRGRPSKALRGEMLLDDYDRRQLRRRKERRILGIAFVIGLAASIVGLYFSPILRVQQVNVTGTSALNPDDAVVSVELDHSDEVYLLRWRVGRGR